MLIVLGGDHRQWRRRRTCGAWRRRRSTTRLSGTRRPSDAAAPRVQAAHVPPPVRCPPSRSLATLQMRESSRGAEKVSAVWSCAHWGGAIHSKETPRELSSRVWSQREAQRASTDGSRRPTAAAGGVGAGYTYDGGEWHRERALMVRVDRLQLREGWVPGTRTTEASGTESEH